MAYYNYNPSPQQGNGPFGRVPGAVGVPDPFGDLSRVYPNLSGNNAAASSAILSELRGQLPADVLDQIQNNAARFGISSGMPGSGLARNRGARDLGLTSLDLIGRGIQNYNQTIPTIKSTQTVSPETQANIATQNAVWAAAPNPASAQNYAQSLFDQYRGSMPSGGGGSMRSPFLSGGSGGSTVPGGNSYNAASGIFQGTKQEDPVQKTQWPPTDWGVGTGQAQGPWQTNLPAWNSPSSSAGSYGGMDQATSNFLDTLNPDEYF